MQLIEDIWNKIFIQVQKTMLILWIIQVFYAPIILYIGNRGNAAWGAQTGDALGKALASVSTESNLLASLKKNLITQTSLQKFFDK